MLGVMRRMLPFASTLIALLLAVFVASGCGGDDSGGDSPSGGKAALAVAVPGNSLAYGEVLVRPQGQAKDNVLSVLGKLLDKPSSEVAEYLRGELEKQEDGGDFASVEKLIGDRIAFAVTELPPAGSEDPGVVLAIETPDADALLAAAKKETPEAVERTYNGVTYLVDEDKTALGIVDDRGYFGSTEAVFKAAVDKVKAGDTLDKQQRFTETIAKLGADQLALIWVDGKNVFEGVAKLADSPSDKQVVELYRAQLGDGDLRVALGLTAPSGTTLALDGAVLGAKQGAEDADSSDLVEEMPGDAWAAMALGQLGKTVQDTLDQMTSSGGADAEQIKSQIAEVEQGLGLDLRKDLLSWMGDAGVFVRGSDMSSIGGALVIESTDEAKSKKALATIERIAGQAGQGAQKASLSGGAEGIKVTQDGMTYVVATKGDRFTVAVSEQAANDALNPSSKLEDNAAFKAAESGLGDLDPMLFLDFQGATGIVQSLASGDPESEQSLAVMKRLSTLVAGADSEDGEQRVRMLLTTK